LKSNRIGVDKFYEIQIESIEIDNSRNISPVRRTRCSKGKVEIRWRY